MHMLQCHKHSFDHSRTIEQLLQIVRRKSKAWVHVIIFGPLRYNASIPLDTFLLQSLRIHVILAALADPLVKWRKIISDLKFWH